MELNKKLLGNILQNNLLKILLNLELIEKKNEFRLLIKNEYLKNFLYFLKNTSFIKLNTLLDLFGIDYIKNLQVNYYLLSLELEFRLLLKIKLFKNSIISINDIFLNSNWLEREVWDLFGIFFEKNYDLRRILTDYGFDGFPLLKIFPLSGYIELFYTNELKRILMKKIELTQEYRVFELNNSWTN